MCTKILVKLKHAKLMNTMFSSRRALLYHVNSSLIPLSRNNYVSTFSSSIPHKNRYQVDEGGTTPAEELSQVLKTAQGSGVDRGSREHGVMEKGRHTPPVEEMVKAAAVGAMETGLKLGRIAKHTMDAVWDIAEKTTESVRDSVANDNDRRFKSEGRRV